MAEEEGEALLPSSREGAEEPAPADDERVGWALGALALASLATGALGSAVVPFLPLALSGSSAAVTGVVFAALPAAGLVASPLAARCPGASAAALGAALEAAGCVVGAVAGDSAPLWTVSRAALGAGGAYVAVSATAALSARCVRTLGAVNGLMEAASGAGFIFGPVVGGALYTAYGAAAPQLLGACAFALLVPLVYVSIARVQRDTPSVHAKRPSGAAPAGLRSIVTAGTSVSLVTLFLTAVSFGIMLPLAQPHLSATLHTDASGVGRTFSAGAFTYVLVAPVVGPASDGWMGRRRLVALGAGLLGTGFVLLGPPPFFRGLSRVSMWLEQGVALSLYGGGFGCAFVPLLPLCQDGVRHLGEAGLERMAGLFSAVYSGGQVVGPLVGPLLVSAMGFTRATGLVGAGLFASAAANAYVWRRGERATGEGDASELC